MVYRKIFDLMVYLGDIDTHALGRATSAAAIGLRSWTIGASVASVAKGSQKNRDAFGLRFVQADADIAEKIGLVSEIRAQLCLKQARCHHVAGRLKIAPRRR